MRLSLALTIAEAIRSTLSPLCDRCCIAGSIRRKKAEPKDIEIVCIPRPADILQFVQVAEGLGEIIKGSAAGKYIQMKLPQGINLDLFITTPERFGWIYLIRTGSAEFSHAMALRLNDHGLTSVDGMVTVKATGRALPMREEEDVFKLINMPYIPPENRI